MSDSEDRKVREALDEARRRRYFRVMRARYREVSELAWAIECEMQRLEAILAEDPLSE